MAQSYTHTKIVIVIPCYNEAMTIEKVILDCKKHAPFAEIYVIDNASTDATAEIATNNQVNVLQEFKKGKSFAIKKAFTEINADIYIMIDGDDTYPLEQIEQLIEPILQGQADMVVGDRHALGCYKEENSRKFHGFGNNLVKKTLNFLFRAKLNDILSGYRVFSKKFVKNYPLICDGFELELDLTVHALHYQHTIQEIPIKFKERPEGSHSKLNTFSDGFKIMRLLFELWKDNKPFAFFSILSLVVFIVAALSGLVVIKEFTMTHYISHVPLAILSSSSLVLSFLLFISGLILDTLVKQDFKGYTLQILKN